MSLEDFGMVAGIGLLVGIIIFVLLIPAIATIILGVAAANALGLTGIVWWAFLIVFFLICSSLMSLGGKLISSK